MTPKQRAERTTRAARQTVRQSSVPVFKVVGGLRQSQNISPEPAPTRLSLTLKREVLKQLGLPPEPGSVFVNLSPSQPNVANKGALVFVNADIVEGGEDYAFWDVGNQTGRVELWFKSPAGRSYLVECGVGRPKQEDEIPSASFKIHGPDGTIHTITLDSWGGNLVFNFKAGSSGWYGFKITGKTEIDPMTSWRFHRCEVTNL
jgi:hypothetical protein